MLELISDPNLITTKWLTEVLRAGGLLREGCVVGASWEMIGTGKMGDNARFTLTYDGDYDAPETLVAKLPATDETARMMAGGMGAYRKEVMFYKELANKTAMNTPDIYLALIDDDGSDFVILMKDLAPAEPGDQLVGETLVHAKQALAEAAKLHGAFYGKSDLLGADYITRTDAESAAFGQELLEQNWPGFVERFGHGLSEECIAFGHNYVAHHARWLAHYTGPKTLIHGDFRSENMLFSEHGRVATVDWQTLTESCALADVAYFIGGSLDIDVRRNHEEELLDYYRHCLAQEGVTLSKELCWQLYREFSINGLLITVLGAMFSEAAERSDKMFMVMIQRHLQHCVDMNAQEFL
ncbi:MAG: phosphotransferase [Proteobacteria bacterium]|nr:phosphotransferase [Pseudomonadota bacterium]